ncbi:DUF2254 domain-containing protein [bacterium]|nr:MAG: DUF2254 domain-containing protein [bacterium]
MIRLQAFWEKLRTNYWFVPAVMSVVAIALSFVLVGWDRTLRDDMVRELGWVYSGGPEGARGVLSTIASSVIGVAGTTFSITIAVLSLATGQYGPRLLRGFMRDRGNQIVLGTFTSTFLYCLLVLRTVRGTDADTYVPHLSVTFAVLLAIANMGVLIYFVNHVAESIQVSRIIEKVGNEVDASIERLFPEEIGSPQGGTSLPAGSSETVRSEESGYVVSVDEESLLRTAAKYDLVLKLVARPGDHVIFGMPLVSVWPGAGEHENALRGAYALSRTRTAFQDAEFALMELAEIGVRALSPGTNDPFTAIACLDRLAASMCRLAERKRPSAFRRDDEGRLRVVAEPYPYGRLVAAAFGHIRHAAMGQPAVLERLRITLDLVRSRAEDASLMTALDAEKEAASV